MGQSTFPVPSSGSSTSTILPVNASSVILDGSLTSASTYTTTVNGNGGIAYMASSTGAYFTIGGTQYLIPQGTSQATTTTVGSGASVTVSAMYNTTAAPNYSSWTAGSAFPNGSINGMAFGNGTFVSTVSSNGNYSTNNGASWTNMTLTGSPGQPACIFFGGGYFIVNFQGNYSTTLYSTNGFTWTAATLANATGGMSGAYGNGTYVVIPYNAASANYSTNGTTWNAMTLPTNYYGNQTYTAYGNGYFYVCNQGSSNAAYSANGITWTAATAPSTTNGGLAYGNGYWAMNQIGTSNVWYASATPPISWTSASSGYSQITGMIYAYGWFVSVGRSSQQCVLVSSNGFTWSVLNPLPVATNWTWVAAGNGTFVAGSSSTTNNARFSYPAIMPVNFGIYNGPTTIN